MLTLETKREGVGMPNIILKRFRVGTLAYATDQGLGYLAKAFYDAGVVTDVLVVEHSSRTTHREWYPDSIVANPRVAGSRSGFRSIAEEFISQMDVMLFFETPFDWTLIQYCRQKGIRSVLMPMYECMPRAIPFEPNLYLCPSKLDLKHFPSTSSLRSVYLPIPVSKEVEWKERGKVTTFVHNSGHGGLKGRNGTKEFVEALGYVKSPCNIILRAQSHISVPNYWGNFNLKIEMGTRPYKDLYRDGECFVFPEKFNGLSLPLQEARASGMLVMTTDRFPNNDWLPREPLIPTIGTVVNAVSPRCIPFEESIVDPRDIASKIDEFFEFDATEYSKDGRAWAEENSWEKLKPRYMEVLEG